MAVRIPHMQGPLASPPAEDSDDSESDAFRFLRARVWRAMTPP